MKQIKTFSTIIISACLLFSCNGNKPSNNNSTTTDASAPATRAAGKSSFSANIDGEAISGGTIDDMQLENTAFIYPTADSSGKKLLFFLHSNKKGDMAYSFRFSIPDKTGSFTKKDRDDQPFDISLHFLGGDLSGYGAEDVTVNIISVNDKNVTGTFSGKFLLGVDSPNGTKKEVTVTDGKFDVPFSTGTLRPE